MGCSGGPIAAHKSYAHHLIGCDTGFGLRSSFNTGRHPQEMYSLEAQPISIIGMIVRPLCEEPKVISSQRNLRGPLMQLASA